MKVGKILMTAALAGGISSSAGAWGWKPHLPSWGEADKALNTLNDIHKEINKLGDYKQHKNEDNSYTHIRDENMRRRVETVCKDLCNRFSCKKGEVKQGCAEICPDRDTVNCRNA